jgi:hypothetical protein
LLYYRNNEDKMMTSTYGSSRPAIRVGTAFAFHRRLSKSDFGLTAWLAFPRGGSQLTPVTQVVTVNVQGVAVCSPLRKQQVKTKSLDLSTIRQRCSSVRNLLS